MKYVESFHTGEFPILWNCTNTWRTALAEEGERRKTGQKWYSPPGYTEPVPKQQECTDCDRCCSDRCEADDKEAARLRAQQRENGEELTPFNNCSDWRDTLRIRYDRQ